MESPFDCKINRRFGIELEVNPLTGVVRRPDTDSGEIPVGSDYIASLVHKTTGESVVLQGWDHVHNNPSWIVKPDNSCGIEINSRVLKGWSGLEKILQVIDALNDAGINSDQRCSLHVHVDISDLTPTELASVVAHYIKCEHIFFDAFPAHRKNSRYCQVLGMTDLLSHDFYLEPMDLIQAISGVKYYSINCYHFCKGGNFSKENPRKKTIEFRIMEGAACLDTLTTKNWIRFLLHFVEVVSKKKMPPPYHKGDKWSSLLWLDPEDLFSILHFDQDDLLSPGLKQTRDWFLARLVKYGFNTGKGGIWSNEGRSLSWEKINQLNSTIQPMEIDDDDPVYSKKYRL